MGTILEKLNAVLSSKNEMKQAIIDKGVACDDVLSTYADKILAIESPVYGYVNITTATNQADSSDIIGKEIIVTYGDVSTTLTIDGSILVAKIPQYAYYTITFPSVDGYSTPASISGTSSGGVPVDVSAVWQTETVSVSLSAEDGTSVVGQVVTINGTDYTWQGTAISVKIPFGTEYSIGVNALSGYATPASVTYTANQATRDVTMQYETIKLGVYILDTDGKLTTSDNWDTANNSKVVGIAVLTSNVRVVIAKDSVSTKAWGTSVTVSGITTTTASATALTDYNGVSNTDAIISKIGSSTGYAAGYCRAYSFADGRVGYLPALGEWNEVINNKTAVAACLTKVGGTSLGSYNWSSTQYNQSKAWQMRSGGSPYSETKTRSSDTTRAFTQY